MQFKAPQPKQPQIYELAEWLDPRVAAQAQDLLGRLGIGNQYSTAHDRPVTHKIVSALHYRVRHTEKGRPNDALAMVFRSEVDSCVDAEGYAAATRITYTESMQESPYVSGPVTVLSNLTWRSDLRPGERLHYRKFYVTTSDSRKFNVLHLVYTVDSEANNVFLMQPNPGTTDDVAEGYQEWADWPFRRDEVKINFVLDINCVGPHDRQQLQL